MRLTSDPRHKRPFPMVYRLEEAFAVWRRIKARDAVDRGGGFAHPGLARSPSGRRGRHRFARRRAQAHDAHRAGDARRRFPTRATCSTTTSRRRWPARSRASSRIRCPEQRMRPLLTIQTRRGAYAALVVLTLMWGTNWIVMKFALMHAHPVVFNVHRTWLAVAALFAVMAWQRRLAWPAVVVADRRDRLLPGTVNFGSTTMALASAAARAAHRCWCSRCRSGRCCSRGPCSTSACAASSGSQSRSRSPAWCSSSSRGAGRATSTPSSGPCCRDSDGRRAPSP